MRPTGRARVDQNFPQAFATCDRCGMFYNRVDLVWQYEYAGNGLRNTGFLFCTRTCLDVPQPQLKTRNIPPDPPPILNARVEPFAIDNEGGFLDFVSWFQSLPTSIPFDDGVPWNNGGLLAVTDGIPNYSGL